MINLYSQIYIVFFMLSTTLSFAYSSNETCPDTLNTVLWSTLKDTNDNPPDRTDIVVVEQCDKLIIDQNMGAIPANAKGVLVYGELTVEDADTDLSLITDWILVVGGGKLNIGSESDPFKSSFEIVLAGEQSESFSLLDVINETEKMISSSNKSRTNQELMMLQNMVGNNNYNFLMASGHNSVISIHTDDANQRSWCQLTKTAKVNATELKVNCRTGWEVGDRIVVASTDFDLNQTEEFTITGLSKGGRTIHLDHPLQYMHYGKVEKYQDGNKTWKLDMRAEVAKINRLVKIRGDVAYDYTKPVNDQVDTYGGHTMIMNGAKMYISGVEFEHMGQGGKIGRYPTHWHMLEDASGQYIKNSTSHHVFNKGFTIHGTINVELQDNVTHETISHGYFFEDGAEVCCQVLGNLAMNVRVPQPKDKVEGNDDRAAGFWIENANNRFRQNHVAGSEANGFWFDLVGVNGASNQNESLKEYESREGPRDFINNTAHSIKDFSISLAHRNLVLDESYRGTDENPQIVQEDWRIKNLTIYKGDGVGIWVRGIGGIFDNVKMAEVSEGTRLRFNQEIRNSFIVGRTKNIGNPVGSHERTLASDGDFVGHQIYDGPAGLNNVHFAGFHTDNDRAMRESNAVQKSTLHYVNALSFDDDTPNEYRLQMKTPGINFKPESRGILDIDGSLTGNAGSQIISNVSGDRSLYEAPISNFNLNWNAIINREKHLGSVKFRHFNSTNSGLVITRENGGASISGFPINNQQFLPFEGEYYTLDFTEDADSFQLYMSDFEFQSNITLEIKGLGSNLELSLAPDYLDNTEIVEVYSQSELDAATQTSLFRKANEESVVLKMFADMRHGWLFPQPDMTYNNVLIGGLLVDVVNPGLEVQSSSLKQSLNAANEDVFQIFPNPATNQFSVKNARKGDIVSLLSMNGRVIREYNLENGNVFALPNIKEGFYFVNMIREGEKIFSGKLYVNQN